MKLNTKRFSVISIVLFAVILIASCGKGGSSYNNNNNNNNNNGGNDSNAVSITGFAFSSSNITVSKGTKVTWTNKDNVTHTVTSDDGTSFDSGSLTNGGTFSVTFNTAGTFTYHCKIHTSMTGKVTVQ